MKTAIVMEGGALRTIYSAGVCDALLDAKLMPDYFVGVSAGSAYGVSYLSQQKRRNLQIACNYANDRRYMGIGNLLNPKNRSYFGLDFSYREIPDHLIPFDYDALARYPGEAEAVVTNLDTGRADYLPIDRGHDPEGILQATCAMPLLFPIYHIHGQPYLDGGCADPIPYQRAFDRGCDRVVVILTRERSYVRRREKTEGLIEHHYRRYPNFVATMRRRTEAYNQCRERLFQLEREGRVLVLSPESTAGYSRTEKDVEKIRTLWQNGYFDGRRMAVAIRTFWGQDGR